MRSALVGCCAAALALVAPVRAIAGLPTASAPSIAEKRLCRDNDILVCGTTGDYPEVVIASDGSANMVSMLGSEFTYKPTSSVFQFDAICSITGDSDKWQCHPPPSAGAILPGIPPGAQVTVVDYRHFAANDPVGVAFDGGFSVLTVAAKNATGSTGYYTYDVCDGSGYTSGGGGQGVPSVITFSTTESVQVDRVTFGPATKLWMLITFPFSSDIFPTDFCSAGWTSGPEIQNETNITFLTYSYGPPAPTAGELAYAAVYGELFDYSSLGGAAWLNITRTTSPILGAVRHANDRGVKVTLQRNILNGGAVDEVLHLIENQTSVTLTTPDSFADSFACTFAPASGADDPFDYFVAEPSGRVYGRANGTVYYGFNAPLNETTTYACTCVLPPSKVEVCVIVTVTPDSPTLISFDRGLFTTLAPTMCGGTATAEAIAVSPSSSVLPDEYRGVRLSCIMPYTVPTFSNGGADQAGRKRRGDSGRPVANLASKRMEIDVFDAREYYNGTFPDRQCNFSPQTAAVFNATAGWEPQSNLCFPAPLVAEPALAEAKCGPANGADGCTLVSVVRFLALPLVACACAPPPPPPRGRVGSASNSNSNSNTGGVALVAVGGVGVLIVGGVIAFSRTPKSSDEYMSLPQPVDETRM